MDKITALYLQSIVNQDIEDSSLNLSYSIHLPNFCKFILKLSKPHISVNYALKAEVGY
jgi:hypothetical protein